MEPTPATQSTNTTASNSAASSSTASKGKRSPKISERLAQDLREFERVASEIRAKLNPNLPDQLRRRQVLDAATELFGVAPTWVSFFREICGTSGVARTLFKENAEYASFECSEEHGQILTMITALRARDLPENDPAETQRMITVRIPMSLHEAICDEANRLQVSVNKLCISRMLQKLDSGMIPQSQQKRRGRKPGAAENRKTMKERQAEKAAKEAESANLRVNPDTITPSQSTQNNQPSTTQGGGYFNGNSIQQSRMPNQPINPISPNTPGYRPGGFNG